MHKGLFLLLFLSSTVFAQNEQNVWHFGQGCSLDFNFNPPQADTSAIYQLEGCSSICDAVSGDLLFYSDGQNVWNRNNQAMPNGFGLLGTVTTTQAALIVRMPSSDSLFYLFTNDISQNTCHVYYSIVDMSLNSGLGDVILKNQPVFSPNTEQIAAVQHANGQNVWLVTHMTGTYAFGVVEITPSGLSPVEYTNYSSNIGSTFGYMNFSKDGSKLARVSSSYDVDVFNFDGYTGQIYNRIQIRIDTIDFWESEDIYGLDFSPSGNFMYTTKIKGDATNELRQYDVSIMDSTAITNSMYKINLRAAMAPSSGAIKSAPDGKMYISYMGANRYLDVINNPEVAGAGFGFQDSAVYFPNSYTTYGLPNHMAPMSGCGQPKAGFTYTQIGNSITFQNTSAPNIQNTSWTFGDFNTSNINSPTHTYADTGYYEVCLIINNACGSDTICDSINVKNTTGIDNLDNLPEIKVIPVIEGTMVHVKSSTPFSRAELIGINGKLLCTAAPIEENQFYLPCEIESNSLLRIYSEKSVHVIRVAIYSDH